MFKNHAIAGMGPLYSALDQNSLQDPLLAFPFRYVSRLGPLPSEPRRLKMIKPAKKKDYLSLANILLQTQPTEATRRSVEFLLEICTSCDASAVPRIEWIEDEPEVPVVQLGQPSALGRICPLMAFRAILKP